jgi:hypothetical protein
MFVKRDCEGFHRRDFLQVGSAGLLGLTLPQLLRAEAKSSGLADQSKATGVILVWLAGGPATIDMWDNKPDAPEGIRGQFKSIDTRARGVQFSEHLPKMAGIADKVSVVRSLAHTIPSHQPGTVFMTTGNKPTAALQYPALGSLCSKLLPVEKGVPPYVSFQDLRGGTAGGAGYLGAAYNPFGVEQGGGNMRVRGVTLPQGFTLEDLEKRDKLLKGFDKGFRELDEKGNIVEGLDAFHKQALDILRSDRTRKAFNLAGEKDAVRQSYGTSPFGQGCLAARKLIEAGVRFVTIATGGWDTHRGNFDSLKGRLLPNLDTTLSALIRDLDERGMLDSTIVMCAGEFGRTPRINKTAGRDHWARSMACVLAGGGIRRGYAHGTTDSSGMAPATDPCTPDDIAATIVRQLGIDPHMELTTPTGRPVQLFREGRVIEKLIG